MQDAARLLRMGDDVHGHPSEPRRHVCGAARVARRRVALGGGVEIQDWTNEHANFFRSIAITKRILFVVLSLMVAVAAFNIVSTMVMVVKRQAPRHRHPAHLRRLAAQHPVGIRGAGQPDRVARHRRRRGAGVAVAVNLQELVHGLESIVGFKFLDARVYFMSDLPARVRVIGRGADLRLRIRARVPVDALSGGARARLLPAESLRND
jgi:lipoprotein-releasing system permease protein